MPTACRRSGGTAAARAAEFLFAGSKTCSSGYDIGQPPAGFAVRLGRANAVDAPGCTDTSGDGGGVSTWTFDLARGWPQGRTSPSRPQLALDAYDAATRYTGHPANIRT